MTTQRKADSRAESLGQIADLRARVLALMPVRDAAVSVAILLARGIHPHPGILDRLQSALRASHWTVRNPAANPDSNRPGPRAGAPAKSAAPGTTGGSLNRGGPWSQHKSAPALLSSPAAQRGHYGRPPAPATVVVLAARGCERMSEAAAQVIVVEPVAANEVEFWVELLATIHGDLIVADFHRTSPKKSRLSPEPKTLVRIRVKVSNAELARLRGKVRS